jgi:hypothetical protein
MITSPKLVMTVGSAKLDGHDASVDVTSNSPEVGGTLIGIS